MSGRRMEVGGTDVPAALLAAVRNYLDVQCSGRATVLAYWALKFVDPRVRADCSDVLWEIAELIGRKDV